MKLVALMIAIIFGVAAFQMYDSFMIPTHPTDVVMVDRKYTAGYDSGDSYIEEVFTIQVSDLTTLYYCDVTEWTYNNFRPDEEAVAMLGKGRLTDHTYCKDLRL